MQEPIQRPWGYFQVYKKAKTHLIKKIVVKPMQRLSLQSHKYRAEQWILVSGKGKAEVGKKRNELVSFALEKGTIIDIEKKEIHRLSNTSKKVDLVILEVQTGEKFLEKDIVRYEDDYDRTGQ